MDNPIELRTERLLLRRYKPDDIDDLLEYSNSPGWERYLINVPYPYTKQVAEDFLKVFMDVANWEQQGILANFAIVLEGKVVGEVYLNQPSYLNPQSHSPTGGAELGYSLSRQHWGKGLMTEAAGVVVDWIFQTYSFNRIFATCDPRNIGSWRVMEKLGMKREGWLRSHIIWNGEVRDQLYYGILRAEWKANSPRSRTG